MTAMFLKQRPGLISEVAERHGREWAHLYPGWDAAMARGIFEAERGDGGIPATLIALEGETLLGSVSLVFDDLPGGEPLNPWLASLLVTPEHRGRGVGAFLVRKAERVLVENGVGEAFLFTESAQAFFGRHGWREYGAASCNGHPVTILTKRFGERA